MEIAHSTRDGCLVVTLTGQVTVATASQVQHTLLRGLSEGPQAVVCDLGGVDVLDPVCATVFASVANHPASHWPATPLLLCGARPTVAEVLGALDARHFLPQFATLEEALGAVLDRPPYLPQFTITLPVHGAEVLRHRRHPRLPRPAAQAHAVAGLPGDDVPETSDLTPDERRLLPLLATHLTFREIGERLELASHGVRTQMLSIYLKLGVASRSQAIQRARHLGML